MGRWVHMGPWARPMGPKMAAGALALGPGSWVPGPSWARVLWDPGPWARVPAAIFAPMGLAHGPIWTHRPICHF